MMELNNPKIIAKSLISFRRLEQNHSDDVAHFLYAIGSVDNIKNDGRFIFRAFEEVRVSDVRYFLYKNNEDRRKGLTDLTISILERVEEMEHYFSYSFTELMLTMHNIKHNGSSRR